MIVCVCVCVCVHAMQPQVEALKVGVFICARLMRAPVYVCVCLQMLCVLVMSICVSVCFVSVPMFACRSQLNLSRCQGEKLHHPAPATSSSQKSKEYECFYLGLLWDTQRDCLLILPAIGHSDGASSHYYQLGM